MLEFILTEHSGEKATIVTAPLEFDRVGVRYVANSNNTGGTLTVSDGTNTANLGLFGQYTAASFAMATDGSGGTLIHDPPATVAQTLTQPQHA